MIDWFTNSPVIVGLLMLAAVVVYVVILFLPASDSKPVRVYVVRDDPQSKLLSANAKLDMIEADFEWLCDYYGLDRDADEDDPMVDIIWQAVKSRAHTFTEMEAALDREFTRQADARHG